MGTRQQHERTRRLLQRLVDDQGWAGTPVMIIGILFLLLIGFQATLWLNGKNVAEAATQSGYTVARAYESNDDAGVAAAQQLLDELRGSLRDAKITITRTADTVTVTVTGRVATVMPGVELPPVTSTLTGPTERWVPAQ